ncbi:methyltransferase family protein [Ilumatobacter fluminis]|uniref:Methyltransferase family protein n=1 Tax=Ilumatobacter fluminis TaxID=467091 RepID=A0A4R7I3Z1_9ACTN|nr:class I SAM-dependent methyltransferase [Ilumatobacter fluminis]TDT18321.1 methyltransferase family protein [Ilumatobacter fluminis]
MTRTTSLSDSARVRADARVGFALALRRSWATRLYPLLREQAEADGPATPEQVHDAPVHRWFAWTERNSQKQLWRAVQRRVRLDEADGVDTTSAADLLGSARLDPDLDLPDWYTAVDIHLQPGGVWSTDEAAAVYELGAKLVMLGDNDDYGFHRLFGTTTLDGLSPERIVDVGCGFGKSTWALKQQFPDAEVIGVDLAAPLVTAAQRLTSERGLEVEYRQADARSTGLPDACADIVTSTMLLHEMPPSAIGELMHEAARILKPGGVLRMLDFHPTGDTVRDTVMAGHGERNNEPYMPMLFETDVPALCAAAGLTDARWDAFDERAAGRLDGLEWPDRAEWHFPWAVLSATRPDEATDGG